ncbi:hypothetical protein [Hyalangium versicolor]|uniref:hypothetical protein n=1 Tax=Hyalangium versicolor TaxID=2861190 RepID=UPI001CCD1CA2|nr:hypothetical protein [Hyalangium versicolor]
MEAGSHLRVLSGAVKLTHPTLQVISQGTRLMEVDHPEAKVSCEPPLAQAA